MQQKVLLVCKIYLFCIYFSLNNFNYPKKKYGNPICKTFADEIQHLLGFWSLQPQLPAEYTATKEEGGLHGCLQTTENGWVFQVQESASFEKKIMGQVDYISFNQRMI